jgi:hypothetical protein
MRILGALGKNPRKVHGGRRIAGRLFTQASAANTVEPGQGITARLHRDKDDLFMFIRSMHFRFRTGIVGTRFAGLSRSYPQYR